MWFFGAIFLGSFPFVLVLAPSECVCENGSFGALWNYEVHVCLAMMMNVWSRAVEGANDMVYFVALPKCISLACILFTNFLVKHELNSRLHCCVGIILFRSERYSGNRKHLNNKQKKKRKRMDWAEKNTLWFLWLFIEIDYNANKSWESDIGNYYQTPFLLEWTI